LSIPHQPQIRPLELIPLGDEHEGNYVLRDPYGMAQSVVLPPAAAILVSLMNGQRTLGDLRQEFQKAVGSSLTLPEIENLVAQLDELHFLESESFAAHKQAQIDAYQALTVRPAAHAGAAYEVEPTALRQQLSGLFTSDGGPGLLPWEGNSTNGAAPTATDGLCGIMSPHIDFHRGGPSFAWAYDRVVTESQAKLFIVLGTAHTPLQGFYSVSRKHYDTPLGTVSTDLNFVAELEKNLARRSSADAIAHMFQDELPHRFEHSIEFQALMLQFVLGGRRDFRIVPILVGSFQPFVEHRREPTDTPAVADFVSALRETVDARDEEVCFVSGVDLAHIGRQFGDEALLDKDRLTAQWTDDQQLLSKACAGDSTGWFDHIASQQDRNRICGLAPTYTMLEAMCPGRGELLKYDQAVAEDGTSCVSFASVAFYE